MPPTHFAAKLYIQDPNKVNTNPTNAYIKGAIKTIAAGNALGV